MASRAAWPEKAKCKATWCARSSWRKCCSNSNCTSRSSSTTRICIGDPRAMQLAGLSRERDNKLGILADLGVDLDRTLVFLHHNVTADRQPQASAGASRFGSKKGLEELITYLRWDAV